MPDTWVTDLKHRWDLNESQGGHFDFCLQAL